MEQTNSSNVVLITGCSSGFGLHMAARLASCGHLVYATMRSLEKKGDLEQEIKKRGTKVEILPLDVTDPSSIRTAVDIIKTKAERIDVLINNAGYGLGGFFEDLTQEEIRAQIETNFFGVQNVTREVLPLMREQRSGTIINISSISGLYALPCLGAYNASKWALEGFSESLYYELKPFGIHVCVIEPGTYKTKIFHENRRRARRFDDPSSAYYSRSKYLSNRVDKNLKKIIKDPEDIALLAERLIRSKNPPFRNIPDAPSKILIFCRRFLPFRIFSWIFYRLLYGDLDKKEETKTI